MAIYSVEISAEEEKALLVDMISIQEWLNNAIHNKARQMIDEVCRQALEDETNTILAIAERREVGNALVASGKIISSIKQMPEGAKRRIVAKARVKSAAERRAEPV